MHRKQALGRNVLLALGSVLALMVSPTVAYADTIDDEVSGWVYGGAAIGVVALVVAAVLLGIHISRRMARRRQIEEAGRGNAQEDQRQD